VKIVTSVFAGVSVVTSVLFLALHILWDWTKYNHNHPSWLSEPSITFKILAYCDTGVYNTCFKISSDLASSKKNHHLGFQQSGPIGVLPYCLKSSTARIAEPRRKSLSSLKKFQDKAKKLIALSKNFPFLLSKLWKCKAKKTSVYVGASQFLRLSS